MVLLLYRLVLLYIKNCGLYSLSQRCKPGSVERDDRDFFISAGSVISSVDTKSAVRSVGFSFSRNLAFYSTDKAMNNPSELFVVDTRDRDSLSTCLAASDVLIHDYTNTSLPLSANGA